MEAWMNRRYADELSIADNQEMENRTHNDEFRTCRRLITSKFKNSATSVSYRELHL